MSLGGVAKFYRPDEKGHSKNTWLYCTRSSCHMGQRERKKATGCNAVKKQSSKIHGTKATTTIYYTVPLLENPFGV